MAARASHLPTHRERTLMQQMRALGELPVHEAASPTIAKLVAKGWIERAGLKAFRVTPAGEAAQRVQLPMSKGNRPAVDGT